MMMVIVSVSGRDDRIRQKLYFLNAEDKIHMLKQQCFEWMCFGTRQFKV